MKTVFLRVLEADDKAAALLDAVRDQTRREGAEGAADRGAGPEGRRWGEVRELASRTRGGPRPVPFRSTQDWSINRPVLRRGFALMIDLSFFGIFHRIEFRPATQPSSSSSKSW